MPRRRKPYTLYPRMIPVKSGKPIKVYYYRVWDENDKQHSYTTSLSSKTEAENYVRNLWKEGKLLPNNHKKITIKEYSRDFWVWEGTRVQAALLDGNLTPAYVKAQHRALELHWWPVVGDLPLDKLTVKDIDSVKNQKSLGDPDAKKRPLSGKRVNAIILALRAVYDEAVRLEDVKVNPFDRVKMAKKKAIKRGHLSTKEARLLLSRPDHFGSPTLWALNLAGFTTGCRAGELLGLKVKAVFGGYIEVQGVMRHDVGFVEDTKTGEAGFRAIPLPAITAGVLADLCKGKGPEDFVFGDLPFSITSRSLNDGLVKAGIMDEPTRIKRKVDFHSWRHLYVSLFRGQVSDQALRATVGHATSSMTENYTSRLSEHTAEVSKAIEGIFEALQIADGEEGDELDDETEPA